jgi:hypothetical protein
VEEGTKLIAVKRKVAPSWIVVPVQLDTQGSLYYKYSRSLLSLYPLLSSISFNRLAVPDRRLGIVFPKRDVQPGIKAQLGVLSPGTDDDKQLWAITESESYSQELSRFYT